MVPIGLNAKMGRAEHVQRSKRKSPGDLSRVDKCAVLELGSVSDIIWRLLPRQTTSDGSILLIRPSANAKLSLVCLNARADRCALADSRGNIYMLRLTANRWTMIYSAGCKVVAMEMYDEKVTDTSQSRSTLALAVCDSGIRLVGADTGQVMGMLRGARSPAVALAIRTQPQHPSDTNHTLLVSLHAESACIWDTSARRLSHTLNISVHPDRLESVAHGTQAQWGEYLVVLVAPPREEVLVFDNSGAQLLARVDLRAANLCVESVALSPAEEYIVGADTCAALHVWHLPTLLARSRGEGQGPHALHHELRHPAPVSCVRAVRTGHSAARVREVRSRDVVVHNVACTSLALQVLTLLALLYKITNTDGSFPAHRR
jgi:hypothetical protein